MDHDGRVKAWLNANLSKCHPVGATFAEEIGNYRKNDRLEAQMVDEIIRIIDQNTTSEMDPDISFEEYISRKYPPQTIGFLVAKQEVSNYADQYKVEIPHYFESVIGIFDGYHHTDDLSPHLSRQDTPHRFTNKTNLPNQHHGEGSQASFAPDQSEFNFSESFKVQHQTKKVSSGELGK